uniref:Myosin IXb n=1 Tax=Cyprinodon variegatus TaxID=28743 RepID=A0A3Q2D9H0_CYPVA
MSTTDGPGTPEPDEESRVVQIYPRLPLETEAYCPLQVGIKDTAKTVIHNAVVTLDLDSSQNYSLLEVRKEGSEEKLLQDGDSILPRVLLWPSETQRWHPRSQGFYFILQQSNNGAKQVGTSKEDSDDLCNLSSVTEEAVLQVLRQRFLEHKIYTYISNILIAINPNKFLPLYYNPKYVKLYENQPLGKLSPHIFAIADVAFRTMLNRQVNQCIMISGESGSGKTESSSYLIHCLTTLSRGTYSGGLERAILGAGPVLEAFGNAETAENNNSSRFGKFFQLIYLESGVIRGAFVEKFLLENSRLVSRGPNERNYHVFYCLLMGASKDEQKEFRLLKLEDYVYLNQVPLTPEYKRLKQAMEMVGFLAPTKKRIFSVLSAILLLGNVTYNLSNDTQVLEAGPTEVLSSLSHLLMVKKEHLVKTLTKKTVVTAASAVDAPYTLQEANSARDSLAKSLYSALFDWIVLHINHAMLNRRDMEESVSCLSIGVLDMFGFENLQKNSFEQLCINYACEKQQFYINQNIFKFKQEDYVSEGITWQNIDFTDNSDCIQLISDKTMGLFSLMNEESSLPHSQDEAMLEKFKRHHQNNSRFVVSPNKEATFTIEHYAGKVNYQVKDFQQKNTEHMRPEFASLLRSSKHSLLHHLVASSPGALFRWGILRATIRIISVFKKLLRQRAEQSKHGLQTLDFSFDRSDEQSLDLFEDIFNHVCSLHLCILQSSLDKLIETIEKAEPFFIFCFRSNTEKKSLHFDDEVVLNQIRYTGILQMIHMQKSSYTAKYTFEEFVKKFRILLPKGATAAPEVITVLFEKMGLEKASYQIGKNKVYLKEKERQLLQVTLNKEVMQRIVTLQRWFRTCLIRMHFLQKRDATMIIQFKFEHCSFLWPRQERVRLRKPKKHKRRLAYARSGLVYNFGGSKESEYWQFPLPPISPLLPGLKNSASTTLPRLSPQSYQTNSNNSKVPRNTTVRISRATRALQADASLDREITDPNELRNLDEFLGNQVNELRTRIKDLSPTENMFLSATMEFRENIKDMYSLKKPQVCYKSLMNGYRNTVTALAKLTNESEVSLVVNLFQSVLDGFIRAEIKRAESEPAKVEMRNLDNPLDHLFSTYQKNIMQSCDLCGSYIWVMEKAYMCSGELITSVSLCISASDDSVPGSLHFGVQVCVLTSKVHPVPKVMELLLMHVELNGLYTEGIYRKSGAACRARELYQILETDPEVANLDNYPIHTITGLVKRWLRELPDPLMTFSLYSDFLHAVELPEKPDRIKAVYQKVDELPPANYNTLERLIFHLVKVAKEEKHNKMTPSSLAIVFAPCILRSPDFIDPFLSMKDVPKTTLCVEILINEQLRRYNEKMQEIHELENAEAEAVNILRLRRQNTVRTQKLTKSSKTLKPECPAKPADLAQRFRRRIAEAQMEQRQITSGQNTDVTHSTRPLPRQEISSSDDTQQTTSKTLNGSFDDLDIPYIDEVED